MIQQIALRCCSSSELPCRQTAFRTVCPRRGAPRGEIQHKRVVHETPRAEHVGNDVHRHEKVRHRRTASRGNLPR